MTVRACTCVVAAACAVSVIVMRAQPRRSAPAAASSLEQQFRMPPAGDKPWVYYWWVKGNVTRQSITRDLEQMKAKGIGGFLLFDARGYGEELTPPPPAPMEF